MKMIKYQYDPTRGLEIISGQDLRDSDLCIDSDGYVPEVFAYDRCEYCGVISLEFDVCPHCGAPKS